MARLVVRNFSVSLDGFGAGIDQSLDNPLGVRGEELHEWIFATRAWRERVGTDGGETGIDDRFIRKGDEGIGATVMGRNMFGPIRGDWPDDEWKGWWGDEPPYHHPVFVLTHHPRDPIPMQGGTTFNFVTDGIESALEQAFAAAAGADVRLGGGVSTIQQYMKAGLLDELDLAIVPLILGSGERLLDRLDGKALGYECVELVSSGSAVHARLVRKK